MNKWGNLIGKYILITLFYCWIFQLPVFGSRCSKNTSIPINAPMFFLTLQTAELTSQYVINDQVTIVGRKFQLENMNLTKLKTLYCRVLRFSLYINIVKEFSTFLCLYKRHIP